MSELTKEHFEQSLKSLATKRDFEQIENRLDGLPTHTDLEDQTDQIGIMINHAFQDQKEYMEDRFNKIEEDP